MLKSLAVSVLTVAFMLGLDASAVLAYRCPLLVKECTALAAKMEKAGDKMTASEAQRGCEAALKLHEAGKHKESVIRAGLAIAVAGSAGM